MGHLWHRQGRRRLSALGALVATASTVALAGFATPVSATATPGQVWGWGVGPLGDGTMNQSPTPIEVPGLTDAVGVSAGGQHVLALAQDGSVWSWGAGSCGRRAAGTHTDQLTPAPIDGLTDVVTVVAGDCNSFAIKTDGTLWAWGGSFIPSNDRFIPEQVAGLTDVVGVASGTGGHEVALVGDGTVWVVGSNDQGQLGDGTQGGFSTAFVQVSGLSDVTAVAAGGADSLALKSDGTVWTWGNGILAPTQVSGLSDIAAVSSDSGGISGSDNVAVGNDGTVWEWSTLPGHTLPGPHQVPGLTGVTSASSFLFHSLALKSDGTVWDWDANDTPVQVSGLANVAAISTGYGSVGSFAIVSAPPPGGSVSEVAGGGETVTTDPGGVGASPGVPVQTSLLLPVGMPETTVEITGQPLSGPSPAGFVLFGQEVVIDTAGVAASAASPFVVTLTVDASVLGGASPSDVDVFRDGVLAGDCVGSVAADPDPCVASRAAGAGDDVVIVVRTSHFSTLTLGRPVYVFGGFHAPVDNLPVVNGAKAGSAIPVKFSLGGDRGLGIFSQGYPRVRPCTGGGPADEIETTTSGNSGLSFAAGGAVYTYVWKTTKSMQGCNDLVLRFRDGTERVARFQLR